MNGKYFRFAIQTKNANSQREKDEARARSGKHLTPPTNNQRSPALSPTEITRLKEYIVCDLLQLSPPFFISISLAVEIIWEDVCRVQVEVEEEEACFMFPQ